MSERDEIRAEVTRIKHVADQLCTAHACLRDKYQRRALTLDIGLLLFSAWVAVLGMIDPELNRYLTPYNILPQLWVGLLGTVTFLLTLFQFKIDWKGRSEAHRQSFGMYAEVKREAGYLLASERNDIPIREFQRLTSRYDMASDVGQAIPEQEFLNLKRAHKLKVAISKHLDDHPGSMPSIARARLVIKDNLGWIIRKKNKDQIS